MTVETMPPRILAIFCEWESVGLVLTGDAGESRRKTFVHRRGDVWSITRLTGGKLTGHMLLSDEEFKTLGDIA
jgi:hypothetical protein